MWADLAFGLGLVAFLLMTLRSLQNIARVPALPGLVGPPPGPPPGRPTAVNPPRCSVMIAARDEAGRIEQTLRRLLAQQAVSLEFIIVDDRSTDGTGAILRRIADEDARVKILRVESLPEGWLGKCHACHLAAGAATGEWMLFTDADCWLKPDVIARALQAAERERADHITICASTELTNAGARAWYLLFLMGMAGWFARANRDRPNGHIGIGAFNLVRASAYRDCGGYQALRLTVVDDVKLGLLLHRAGKRTRGYIGRDDVLCHWGHTVGALVRTIEKNQFAVLDFRLELVVAATVAVLLGFSLIVAGLLSGTGLGFAAALSSLTLGIPAALLARRVGWPWYCGVLVPAMMLVFLYSLLNSTVVTLRRGGVRWRDTFYPIAALRAGNVQ